MDVVARDGWTTCDKCGEVWGDCAHASAKLRAQLAKAREAWRVVKDYVIGDKDHDESCEAAQPYKGACDCGVAALDAALGRPAALP